MQCCRDVKVRSAIIAVTLDIHLWSFFTTLTAASYTLSNLRENEREKGEFNLDEAPDMRKLKKDIPTLREKEKDGEREFNLDGTQM